MTETIIETAEMIYRGECPGRSKGRYGFASMDPEKQRKIATMGGKAAHEKGTAHEWTSEEAREAGRKGGAAVLKKYGLGYMVDIARIGGSAGHIEARLKAAIKRIAKAGNSACGWGFE